MGRIVSRDELDEAAFHIRFKGIEVYHEYDSIADFTKEWRDKDEYMEEEVYSLEKPKSEAQRKIDLFLKRTKELSGNKNWKKVDND